MKSGQPQLRTLPPKLPADAGEKRLAALDAWTEEPVRTAAASIGVVEPTETMQEASKTTGAVEPINKENKLLRDPLTQASDYPWVEFENLRATSQVLLRLPKVLHMKVKWLGETTYGQSMNQIMVRAIETEVKAMLAKRGVEG